MSSIKTWEGRVRVKPDANGVYRIVADANGNGSAENAAEMVAAMIKSGGKFSTYDFWIDAGVKAYPKSGVWTAKDLAGFAKEADQVALVASKLKKTKTGRWFRTPVLAFIKDDAQTPKSEATNGVLL